MAYAFVPDVTILHFPYAPRFGARDLEPLAPEALAARMRVSRGFIRLCLDAGCRQDPGSVSAADLLQWLFRHYEKVRALAGLRAFAPVEDLEPATIERLRMANAVITLLEYTRTRATDWRKKRMLREAIEQVDRAADRTA